MPDLPTRLLAGAHRRGPLLACGVTPGELRGPLWRQALPRRYAWAATDPQHPRQRALVAAAAAPPGGAVGGWAAAYLLGARELDGSTARPQVQQPVLLCMGRSQQRPWWPGVRPFRSRLDDGDVVIADGVSVTSPLRTGFDLARLAGSLSEAVVALDVVVRDLGVDPAHLLGYARARPRWRGVPQVRAAVRLVDARAASAQESRLRMLWVLGAGLPAPRCNWPVLDRAGRLLGVVDLLDVDAGLAGEYDGADHAGAAQRSRDHVRHEQLERHGLVIVRFAAPDLLVGRRVTVRRLRAQHRRGLLRDRGADRWVAGAG